MDGVREGEREAALQDVAGSEHINTLRRSLRALDLIEEWTQHKAPFERFAAVPQSIMEVLARWAAFDDEGAWDAFLSWENARTPVELLTEKMQEARSNRGVTAGRLIEVRYRNSLEPYVNELLSQALNSDVLVTAVEKNAKEIGEPPVDFRFLFAPSGQDEGVRVAAMFIVGPYRSPTLYAKNAFGWLQKAFALAWIYDEVILVMPEQGPFSKYKKWVEDFRRKSENRSAARLPRVSVVLSPVDASEK
ncbi:hypothetical protein UNPA324_27985 [Bradyrhizobium sp. UNPA324]|nr:hypothetical protein UNPA324_27985 [Bradyrhizobium sp. UNPA324]